MKIAKGNTDYSKTITLNLNSEEINLIESFCSSEQMSNLVKLKDAYKSNVESKNSKDKYLTTIFEELENIDALQNRSIIYRLFYIQLYVKVTQSSLTKLQSISLNVMSAFGAMIACSRQKEYLSKKANKELDINEKERIYSSIRKIENIQDRIGVGLGAETIALVEKDFENADLAFIIEKVFI